ncbi:MAG: BMC domain-containing protein [Bryobacterales bacterium]|nr:BMC domain-containing protein [Bryobacterales bacterium]
MTTRNSIGLIELSSIAAGFAVTDAMLKAADVELLLARTICSGKYMVLVRGDVAAVESSVRAGAAAGDFSVIDSFVIPNVDEQVFPAIAGTNKIEVLEALALKSSRWPRSSRPPTPPSRPPTSG